jgi:hypothetical protein
MISLGASTKAMPQPASLLATAGSNTSRQLSVGASGAAAAILRAS